MVKVGIFDSGFGGLTVVRQVAVQFPWVDLVYLGDTARVPYGEKTPEQIIRFNEEIISFLIEKGAEMILMGCNTSSSLALERDRKIFKIPIFALIEPTAKNVGVISINKKIGVLATTATVNAHAYSKKIKKLFPRSEVFEIACPALVPLVEAGKLEGEEVEKAAAGYLRPLLAKEVDTIIFGCTHYPFLKKVFAKITGRLVNFIDPGFYICQEAKADLEKLKTEKSKIGSRVFFTTGSAKNFFEVSSRLIGDIIMTGSVSFVPVKNLKKAKTRILGDKNV